ncbi:ribulokinase [Sphingobacterium tabacisoli]|uniref:Ribulokinase n=1 Tax=Sphingobacterium tabacisoli TaxID=2044855 RepID=A0ABW5L5Z9_9SPHI|nr:ribulokinase [Sphingobacterium tabacisoli]
MNKKYVIGVDYGTDSVRSIIVDTSNGEELASSVFNYPRWKKGLYSNPSLNQFRQHPLDYIEGLEKTIQECVAKIGKKEAANVVGISVDTTGSTPVAVDKSGTPLALKSEFGENPNAMFILWKDHTAVNEASEINAYAALQEIDYLKYVGGVYSSEWFWSKILRIYRIDEQVRNAAYTWVEHCDWIPFLLTGGNDVTQLKRSVCAAGHKGLWAEEFGGYPPDGFFNGLDPLLAGEVDRLGKEAFAADTTVGSLSASWADRLDLNTDVKIGVGAFDAHMGAVGGQIEPFYLSKVMGTSTCDIMVAPGDFDIEVKGICGQVNGSVVPGMVGLEAGQSAFGDAYAWFKNILMWPVKNLFDDANLIAEAEQRIIVKLSEQAAVIEPEVNHPIAIDWLNGRRTPYANQNLKAAFFDVNISTDAVLLYRAVVESTCFGAKKIADCFVDQGVDIRGVIGLGGVAKKSPFVMQMLADILNMPIKIHRSEQTCALGAAMFASVVGGVYPSIEDAMSGMGQGFDTIYKPNQHRVSVYAKRYDCYKNRAELLENDL